MNTEYFQELNKSKGLPHLSSVQNIVQSLINEGHQNIREPIKRSKAQIQTIFITTGYAWCQTSASVTLYINFNDTSEILKSNYRLDVLERSIELNIYNHKGANHNFKINHLCDFVKAEKTIIKFKQDKIVIILKKRTCDYNWPDLRLKSTRKTFHELERHEKSYSPIQSSCYNTPFNNNCHHDKLNKEC